MNLIEKARTRFWAKVKKLDGCWEWQGHLNWKGYGQVSFDGGRKKISAHRVSWMLENGPIPEGLWVLHRCDNSKCVRPDHLYLGDCIQNVRDMWQRGRARNGRGANPKLKDNHLRKIFSMRKDGVTFTRIAQDLHVSASQVSRIFFGQSRKADRDRILAEQGGVSC